MPDDVSLYTIANGNVLATAGDVWLRRLLSSADLAHIVSDCIYFLFLFFFLKWFFLLLFISMCLCFIVVADASKLLRDELVDHRFECRFNFF